MGMGYSPLRRWLRDQRAATSREEWEADRQARKVFGGCLCLAPCYRSPCLREKEPGPAWAQGTNRWFVEPDPMDVSPAEHAFLTQGTPLPPEPTEFYEGNFFDIDPGPRAVGITADEKRETVWAVPDADGGFVVVGKGEKRPKLGKA